MSVKDIDVPSRTTSVKVAPNPPEVEAQQEDLTRRALEAIEKETKPKKSRKPKLVDPTPEVEEKELTNAQRAEEYKMYRERERMFAEDKQAAQALREEEEEADRQARLERREREKEPRKKAPPIIPRRKKE